MLNDLEPHEWYYSDPLGIGAISQLSDVPSRKPKHPLGFPIPEGEPVTPYRERLNAGEYAQDKSKSDQSSSATKRTTKQDAKPKRGRPRKRTSA